ncbi:MAG: hypothetical protein AUH30_03845 [Candidatus Rokubacteria bacterium 13_1_40CM_68_15]|nr:MAG: hypothetical protein AUH30_03845 [Candidatus Rokubacteria bacterium 13_1_40CM_68_15]
MESAKGGNESDWEVLRSVVGIMDEQRHEKREHLRQAIQDKIARGHGLKLIDNGKTLESMACRVEDRGAFCAFLDTFMCDIHLEFPGGVFDAHLRSAATADLSGQTFTLTDLLGWAPDIRTLYRQTFETEQPIARVSISRDPKGGPFKLRFPDGVQGIDWVSEFPVGTHVLSEQHFVRNADVIREITTSSLPLSGWQDWIELAEGGIGWPFSVNVMVERDITRTKHLGPWMAEYAAMFILSGVVRYHPARWVGMIQRKANSKTLALVEAFVSVAETEFPTRVWEMLKRVTVIKGYVTALDELLVKSLG